MSKFYTYDAWVEEFQPIPNHLVKYDQLSFETYGEEQEYVSQQDNHNVWTEVDGDSGTYIVAGYHYVNRIQYYITVKPWEDEFTEVPTWCYRECDCIDEETNGILTYDGDPNPDCKECDGEGTIDIDCATVLDLKQIYGEETEIVG